MSRAQRLREAICEIGASIFKRGLTAGSSGNISVRLADGWLMTPTNASLGRLDPARLSKLDDDGKLVSGDAPTKESFLHRVMYEERARDRRGRAPALDAFGRGLVPRRDRPATTCCRRSPPIT